MDAYAILAERYLEILESSSDFGSGYTSAGHLKWMCRELTKFNDREKKARWIGYVQGVLAAHGIVDVSEEIEICREVFRKECSPS